jgi:hypothetical protein
MIYGVSFSDGTVFVYGYHALLYLDPYVHFDDHLLKLFGLLQLCDHSELSPGSVHKCCWAHTSIQSSSRQVRHEPDGLPHHPFFPNGVPARHRAPNRFGPL